MIIIKQRTRTDCGIAVVATVTGRTYEEAKLAIFGPGTRGSYRTTYKQVAAGLVVLGYKALPRSTRHALTPGIGMVAVWVPLPGGRRGRHWLAYDWIGAREPHYHDPSDGFTRTAGGLASDGVVVRSHFGVVPASTRTYDLDEIARSLA